ncbi:MAG TPA: hypothetical protein VGK19_15305 [Capsulimonadaceae bacterium]
MSTAVHAGTVPKSAPPFVVPNGSMSGKVMCGYQGWFNALGDGSGLGWRHFGDTPGKVGFEMWPDVSELSREERYPTSFRRADGTTAELYSAYNEKTVLRHFEWMRKYGIDGVFLQRFQSEVAPSGNPRIPDHVDKVLQHVIKGAHQYGRVYGLMYDLSGLRPGNAQRIIDDWKHVVDATHLTKDGRYVRDGGKPVVVLWGLGFGGNRPPLFEDGLAIIKFLKNDPTYGGNVVMIGVPYQWRTTDTTQVPFAKMQELVEAADIVSPWAVGTRSTPEAIVEGFQTVTKPDLEWCTAHGKKYMPVLFPGFSWYNLQKCAKPVNQIPRLGGKFLWTQYVQAKKIGATMIYQAMFDEVDEGTAIYKVTNDAPLGEGKSQFLTYEGLPSDFYLKLVGQGTRLIRGEIGTEEDSLVKRADWKPFVPRMAAVPTLALGPEQVDPQLRFRPDLALNKPYIESDPATKIPSRGLTDGSWQTDPLHAYSSGPSPAFPKTVTVDLGEPLQISKVVLGNSPNSGTCNVEISASEDGGVFARLGTFRYTQGRVENHLFEFAVNSARFVRVTFVDSYPVAAETQRGVVGLSELAVYGP